MASTIEELRARFRPLAAETKKGDPIKKLKFNRLRQPEGEELKAKLKKYEHLPKKNKDIENQERISRNLAKMEKSLKKGGVYVPISEEVVSALMAMGSSSVLSTALKNIVKTHHTEK